ncbi:hypothetical protein M0208_06330 [Sphingomonas sp. SUN019]|uniref:hypothetical protein n=1 Tax=Sphingomonas sp. SUN019 TaxID=2937788 RepID=UPI00216477E8|nr:hypothetical protein [Sphingomonas sp. SUN019]UVO50154.1 hypothetical protein M0208_06330 [Sphingomonas sp. SUN019]
MKMMMVALLAAACVSAASAQTAPASTPVAPTQTSLVNEDVGVPVFPYDITDRPYKVLGEVKAGVRKATMFSKSPSQEKIYRELWERGQKLGADAVIKANYGNAHVTAVSWGKTNATGTAIKFLAPGEVAPATPPTR